MIKQGKDRKRGMMTSTPAACIWHRTPRLVVRAGWLAALMVLGGCGGDSGTNPQNYPKPVITDIPEVSEIQSYQVTISWTTDIMATSTVLYGTTSGVYTLKDSNSTAKSTSHRRIVTSLRSNTLYYFVVQSKSQGGVVRSAEDTFRTTMATADLAEAAWTKYRQADIPGAMALFRSLLAAQPQGAEAYTGLGWCCAHPTVDSLTTALSWFSGAIALNGNDLDALAGRGFVRLALHLYNQAGTDLARLLSLNSAYSMANNSKVNARAVRLGLAEARFYLQDFSGAQAQIDQLAPGNGLNSGQPATWQVEGTAFATWPEALLAWIEKLKAQG